MTQSSIRPFRLSLSILWVLLPASPACTVHARAGQPQAAPTATSTAPGTPNPITRSPEAQPPFAATPTGSVVVNSSRVLPQAPPSDAPATRFSSVSELRAKHAAPGTIVEFVGTVTNRCDELPQLPENCRPPNFRVADHPHTPIPDTLRVFLHEGSDLAQLSVKVSDYYLIKGVTLARVGSHEQYIDDQPLIALLQLTPTSGPVQPIKTPTFADGSWSVHDLLEQHQLPQGWPIQVTAYVVDVHRCPVCPPTVACQPCQPNVITASDTPKPSKLDKVLVVVGFASDATPAAIPAVGKRYRFAGTFLEPGHGWAFRDGGGMYYKNHVLAR